MPGPTRCSSAARCRRRCAGWLGVQGPLWPDVRSLWGAVILFVLCLYPYVYLLTRAALAERGVQMMEAARLLGAGLRRRVLQVALPLARPAIAAGVALALMETLADYGVGAYFGLSTFSTGIYKAWLVMNDRIAAAQLASLLLLAVALLLAAERRAQRRLRFAGGRSTPQQRGARRAAARQGGVGGMAAVRAAGVPGLRAAGGRGCCACCGSRRRHPTSACRWRASRHGRWPACAWPALAALAATLLALALSVALRRSPAPGIGRAAGDGAGGVAGLRACPAR